LRNIEVDSSSASKAEGFSTYWGTNWKGVIEYVVEEEKPNDAFIEMAEKIIEGPGKFKMIRSPGLVKEGAVEVTIDSLKEMK